MSVPPDVSWKLPALTLKLPLLAKALMLKLCVAAEPAFLLKLPALTKVDAEPLPSSGFVAVVASLMMPPARLLSTAPLCITTRSPPPMSTVPLLFQVTVPLKVGEPLSVVTPLVVRVPAPVKLVPPRVRALATLRLPTPDTVPPVSDRVGPPARKLVSVAKSMVPPVKPSTPLPAKLVPLKLRVPAVTARVVVAPMV